MNRSILFLLVICFSDLAIAEACIQIVDDEERLACFDATRACATIPSNSGRLDCFDSAYLDADSSNAQAKIRDTSDEGPVEPDASLDHSSQVKLSGDEKKPESAEISTLPDEFGKKKKLDTSEESIEATIVKVTTNALKIDYLRLDNGHVWRENEDNHVRFKVGRMVRIEEGMMGSFNLTMEGTGKIVKVKRVK
jgi:U3 small nucleolar RNA-associated protein 14